MSSQTLDLKHQDASKIQEKAVRSSQEKKQLDNLSATPLTTPDTLSSEESGNFEVVPRLYRIVIVGKTGNGKSSLGNILLGKEVFPIGSGMSSTTVEAVTKRNDAGDIEVVDTPDLVNCGMENASVEKEVKQWKTSSDPLVTTAVVIAIRCDVRYTAEEYAIYKQVKDLWGEGFCKHVAVAFTFADRIDLDREKFKQELQTVCQELQNVLRDVRNQYEIFDCSSGKYGEKVHKTSVENLLELLRRDEQPGGTGIIDLIKKAGLNPFSWLKKLPYLQSTASTSLVGGEVGGSRPAQVTPKT